MDIHRTEEEQVEAIKNWWHENGTALLVVIALALGGNLAWKAWQSSQIAKAESASELYLDLLEATVLQAGKKPTPESTSTGKYLAEQLKLKHGGSAYALYGALFMAKQAVAENDLPAAGRELNWVLDQGKTGFFGNTDESLLLTAKLRLSRVLLAQGEAEKALELINGVDAKAFEPAYAELRGDIYLSLSKVNEARDAYQTAIQAGSTSVLINMKLDDLAVEILP